MFQFTHPVWGATMQVFLVLQVISLFQFTHPVWGATNEPFGYVPRYDVSIHAPRVGCDLKRILVSLMRLCFNSRTPCGVRLKAIINLFRNNHGFNSRTPCGVRQNFLSRPGYIDTFQFTHPVWGATSVDYIFNHVWAFQFTHPVWGATKRSSWMFRNTVVSIHAPRVGCDHQRL